MTSQQHGAADAHANTGRKNDSALEDYRAQNVARLRADRYTDADLRPALGD